MIFAYQVTCFQKFIQVYALKNVNIQAISLRRDNVSQNWLIYILFQI
jgi:hypothetical protein